MSTPLTPPEIARDTLKALAARKLVPTPDNYSRVYHEIGGIAQPIPHAVAFVPDYVAAAVDRPLVQAVRHRMLEDPEPPGQPVYALAGGEQVYKAPADRDLQAPCAHAPPSPAKWC